MKFIVNNGGNITGELLVPGDKSISHRAIIFGALATGTTTINGFLQGEDSLATIAAFQAMGVEIDNDKNDVLINGVGMLGLTAPQKDLDLGNSGTAMRLLTGVLAAQNFTSKLIGDESLMSRPMGRITQPLSQMSAQITASPTNTAPLTIIGSHLTAIDYQMPIASAQLKSAILLAAIYAQGITTITEPVASRDHTELMLQNFDYPININHNKITIQGGGQLTATNLKIPADISSAAFFLVAATIADNSNLLLLNVGVNPSRTGIIEILRLMGANIELTKQSTINGEPVADIRVKSAQLHGITIPENLVALAIDEFPAIFIAAATATGSTKLTGAAELKVKESDRIATMAIGLKTLAVDIIATEDGAIIKGGNLINGGIIDSFGDHRIAMAFAVCALVANSPIIIENCDNVNTSFPDFVKSANSVGLKIT